MEIHELDNTIKKALLCKTNEILPSDETLLNILAGIEKQQARGPLNMNISYKHYIVALFCAVSIIFGTTLFISVEARTSTMELINTVKSVFILDKRNDVDEKNDDEVLMKYAISDNNQPVNADNLKKAGVNVLFLQAFSECFLLNQVYDLGLCLRLLIIGRITLGQTWYYSKFRPGYVPSY